VASKKRSISLSEDLDDKLVELCEALSVSPNSYINNVVAKAVLNERTALVSQNASTDGTDRIIAMFQAMADESSKE
jgi:predicted transcriptional regulator